MQEKNYYQYLCVCVVLSLCLLLILKVLSFLHVAIYCMDTTLTTQEHIDM